jgi:hypothetical protein
MWIKQQFIARYPELELVGTPKVWPSDWKFKNLVHLLPFFNQILMVVVDRQRVDTRQKMAKFFGLDVKALGNIQTVEQVQLI